MNIIKDIEHAANYRPDIDGLRALAVLLVVGFHAFPHQLKGGFIGVDIFFVISGFLISKIILSGYVEKGSFSLLTFYSRRINRIFPALILMLIACFSFGWFALLPDEYMQLNKHIMGGASFIANLLLWNESGYFDNAAVVKPLLHLWSLGVEEQFYILWPLLVWFAWKKHLNLALTIFLVAALSFLLNIETVNYDTTAAFYSPQTRFWELLTGSFLALLVLQKETGFISFNDYGLYRWALHFSDKFIPESRKEFLINLQANLGFIFILIAVLVIKRGRHFPGWPALLPTLGAFLIIGAGAKAWLNRVVLSSRLLVWIGLISFPLYLWHWPLLSYSRIIVGASPSTLIRISAVLLSVVLAWLTYRYIEKPLRFNKNKLSSSCLLLVLMAIITSAASIGYRTGGLPERAGMETLSKIYAQFTGPAWNYSTNDLCLKNYHLKGSKDYAWMFCMASKNKKPTLLLLGNSYANHLYPGLVQNRAFKEESILSIGTCGPQWYDDASLRDQALTSHPCSGDRPLQQQRFIDKIIEKTGSVKHVIMSGLLTNPDEKYIADIKKRIDYFEANKIKVIVFIPHIRLSYDVRNCFSRPFNRRPLSTCEISVNDYAQHLKHFEPLIRSLKATNPQVIFFNPNELYCDEKKCSIIHKGFPLFRDKNNHFSEYGSVELAKIFAKWVLVNIPELATNEKGQLIAGLG